MYYLLACVLGGLDWTACGKALGSLHAGYEAIFVVYVVLTQLALLNVVTGIFVDCATNAAMNDRQVVLQEEMMKEGLHRQELEHIFMEVDDDGDGWVIASVLVEFLRDENVRTYLRCLDISYHKPEEFVKILQASRRGMISKDEFISGCMALTAERSADMIFMLRENQKYLKSIKNDVNANGRSLPRDVAHIRSSLD